MIVTFLAQLHASIEKRKKKYHHDETKIKSKLREKLLNLWSPDINKMWILPIPGAKDNISQWDATFDGPANT